MAANSQLETLRELLVGRERDTLENLRNRVEDRKLRADDLAEVLTESLGMCSREDGDRLKRAMQKPVEACIQESVKRDRKFFADILFPVIGPAIRKSIAEALRDFVASINETVEHTFSPQGLRWRLEAFRTGKSFGEIVLKHTLVYRVDQLFLIDNNSGLLMQHVSHPGAVAQDSDAVSAMLTAIQDFMRDSFATGEDNVLRTVEMGEFTLCLAHGPFATLAGLVRGVSRPELRERFNVVIDTLHADYPQLLREFDGDKQPLETVKPLLDELLLEARETPSRPASISRWRFLKSPALWLGLAVLLLLAYWSYLGYRDSVTRERLAAAFEQEPGFVLLSVSREDDVYRLEGMADPDAREPGAVLAQHRLQDTPVSFAFEPYTSSVPALTLQRVRRALQVPASVAVELVGGALSISGEASAAWVQRVQDSVLMLPGITRVDLDRLAVNPDELAEQQLMLDEERRRLTAARLAEAERERERSRLAAAERQLLALQQAEQARLDAQRRAADLRPEDRQQLAEQQRRQVLRQLAAERRLADAEQQLAALRLAGEQRLAEQQRLEALREQEEQLRRAAERRVTALLETEQRQRAEQRRLEIQRQQEQARRLAAERDLRQSLENEFSALRREIEQQIFLFDAAATLIEGHELISSSSVLIARVMEVCGLLERVCRIGVSGFTDGIGEEEINLALRAERAARMRSRLVQEGNPRQWFVIIDPGPAAAPGLDPQLRKVSLQIVSDAATD